MSHDESIHAYYSWELAKTGQYVHDPTYHGPLLYHLGAFVFLLTGDSDWTARLSPALAGLLLLALLSAMTRYIGEAGAFLAGVLVTISPALLFYSRYLRNDIYMAVLAVSWILCTFRYLETRRPRWLAGVTAAMALSFACKETSFIFGTIVGSFFLLLTAVRAKLKGERGRESSSGELVLLMLTLVLPFAAPAIYLVLGWDPTDFDSAVASRRLLSVVPGLAAVALALAGFGLRRRRSRSAGSTVHPGLVGDRPGLVWTVWVSLFAIFWGFQVLLFTNWLHNLPRGLISGVIGSLGYWLGQHEVARGGQPWFYYLLIVGLYELLPFVLSIGAGAALIRSRTLLEDLTVSPRPSQQLPTTNRYRLHDNTRLGPVPWLLLWWTAASWLAFSVAGEKMPWLVVHLVLPMAVLSGWWLGRAFDRIDWRHSRWRDLATPVAAPLLLLISAGGLLLNDPFRGREIEAIGATTRFLMSAVIVAAATVLLGRWLWKHGPRTTPGTRWQLLGLGCALALGVLSLRASLLLNFRHHELATELLVYAHSTPDIKEVLRQIDDFARHDDLGSDLPIAYDAATSWPFVWYLRNWPRKHFLGTEPTPELLEIPVVIAGPDSNDRLWPFVGRGYAQRKYRLVWWPIERFTHFGWEDVHRTLRDATRRRQLWQYLVHRRVPAAVREDWPHRTDFFVYFQQDLVLAAWGLGPLDEDLGEAAATTTDTVTEHRVEPLGVLAGPYEGEPLRMPAQVAVTPEGVRLIADAGNDRIVAVARDGSLLRVLPTRTHDRGRSDGDETTAQEARPDSLNEPWGVAALPNGEVAVADTWNGRLLTFGHGDSLVNSWGELEIGASSPIPADRLYGPRSVTYRPFTGELLLADTGNHRIVVLGSGADPRVVGGPGVTEGRFLEPVGIAIDPRDGSVLVADTWNRRVQKLAPDLTFRELWAVPGWQGRGAFNKPYLAVDDRGFVYATDPERSRILVFDSDGRLEGAMVAAGWRSEPAARPLGIAVDAEQQLLVVADAALARVWILPAWHSGN